MAKISKLGKEIEETKEKIEYGTYTPQKKASFAKFVETQKARHRDYHGQLANVSDTMQI